MPKVLANGIQTHYQQAGDGPDIVLVHGLTGDLSVWYLHVMFPLAKEFRVTAYDLRGHGYSEVTASGYTSAQLAADLCGLLDSLRIDRAHLIGHSFGATIALHCAVLYPERVASLVLAEPTIPALHSHVDMKQWPYRETARALFKERGLSIPEEKWSDLEYIVRQTLGAPAHFGMRRETQRSNRRLQRLLDTTAALKEAQEVAGLTMERIAEVRQPTLAIYGGASRFLQTSSYLQEKMPDCRVVVAEGVAHLFAVSKPEVLVAQAGGFLRELAGSKASEPSGEASCSSPDGKRWMRS